MTIPEDRRLRGRICLAALLAICCATATSAAKHKATSRSSSGQSQSTRSGSVTLRTPTPSTPLEHNNRGVELGSKHLWQDAIREHEAALNGDPYNHVFRQNLSGAQMRYAIELANRGNYSAAIGHFREALYADPTNAEADRALDQLIQKTKGKNDLATRLHEADEQEINGNFAYAIVEYRKCALMDDSGPTRAKLGRVLLKQGKIRDAFNELKAAVAKSWPEDVKNDQAECHRQLGEIEKDQAAIARDNGRTSVALKRLENAAIEYRRAVTLNPNNTDAAHGFVEVARDAVSIVPNSFNNHFMLAGAYQLAGDYEHAKMEYETCWRMDHNNDLLPAARRSYHLAVVSHPRSPEILADTVQKVEDELRRTPNNAELLYIYGRGKEAMGEPDVALKAYQAAGSINALSFPDLKERIRSLSGLPPEKPAETQPTKVATTSGSQSAPGKQTVSPDKPSQQPAVDPVKNLTDYSAIESKFRSNDIDGAQSLALALVDKDPRDAKGWLFLGRTHEKKGDLDQASVAYRQAAYLKDPEAKDALRQVDISRVQPMLKDADEAIKKGNWVQAAASLKDAITLAPSLPVLHRRLSEALKQLGDTKEAQREAKRADELERDTDTTPTNTTAIKPKPN